MIHSITKENLKEIIEDSKKPVVLDIFATWCGPCMQMKPIFEALATELTDKYSFAQLNVDEAREVAIQYNATSVPTFLFIKDNKIVGREVGYMAKDAFKKRIEDYLGA